MMPTLPLPGAAISLPSGFRGNSEVFLFDTPYVLDWTVSYINTLDDSPVAYSDILAGFNGKLAASRLSRC